MRIIVKSVIDDQKWTLDCEESSTILEAKQKISEMISISPENIKLIYSGQILQDSKTISFYNIQNEHSLHLVRTKEIKKQSNSSKSSTLPTTESSTERSKIDNTTATARSELGANPDLMTQLLNSSLVENMFNNPSIIETMMSSNPQIQRMVEQNPEMGRLLNDPEFIQRTLNIMRNPSLMQEMIRTQDRTLQNIESHPEGFNALRRLYQDVYDQNDSETPQENPFSSLISQQRNVVNQNSNQALQNPWISNSTNEEEATPTSQTNTTNMNQFYTQILQNSSVQNMLEDCIKNPELFQTMIQNNPYFQMNPAFQESMTNPETLKQLLNPEVAKAFSQLHESLQTISRSGISIPNLNDPMNATLFSSGSSQPSNVVEKYEIQLQQLKEMGFYDEDLNLKALRASNGNVNLAVERLLNSFM